MRVSKKTGKGRCPHCRAWTMPVVAELPRGRHLRLCEVCQYEQVSNSKKLLDEQTAINDNRVYQVLVKLLEFEVESARGLLLIKEHLSRLDPSTTEGQIDEGEFRATVKVIYRMLAIREMMESAGLGKYAPAAIKEVIQATWGRRVLPRVVKQPV